MTAPVATLIKHIALGVHDFPTKRSSIFQASAAFVVFFDQHAEIIEKNKTVFPAGSCEVHAVQYFSKVLGA